MVLVCRSKRNENTDFYKKNMMVWWNGNKFDGNLCSLGCDNVQLTWLFKPQ